MTTRLPTKHAKHAQRGAAAIMLVLLVLLGLITILTFRLDRRQPELDADKKTAMALARAKEALLGWSAVDGGGAVQNPGRLPCPDQDNDGQSQGAACAAPFIGRVPWATLSTDDIRDGAAERLWYIVDQAFRSNGIGLNSTTLPTLTLNGNRVVAVIFSPGPALQGQARAILGAASLNPANYLESYIAPIVTQPPPPAYNDRVISITAAEVFTIVTRRMTREVAQGIGAPAFPANLAALNVQMGVASIWGQNNWGAAVSTYAPLDSTVPGGVNYDQITLSYVNCPGQQFIIRRNTATNTNDVTWTGGSC